MKVSFFLILSFLISLSAHAACTSPAGGEGTIRYDSTGKKFYGCDDTNWVELGGSSGGASSAITTQTSNYTVTLSDEVVAVDATSGDLTLTLPSAVGNTGKKYLFKKKDSSSNTGTISSSGGTFDSSTTISLNNLNRIVEVISDGTNWLIYRGGTGYISATGGTISTDGDYRVHTFNSSGTFEITSGAGNAEVLVVAGGGAGGFGAAGGGGAGGLIYNTSYFIEEGSMSVTVGAGGSGNSASGEDSIFGTLTAIGGGGGSINAGNAGGSGGGAGYGNPGVVGAGTPGQGNDGGRAYNLGLFPPGGGGGAGGPGESPTGNLDSSGSAGGPGLSISITGAPIFYAGGGGASGTLQGAAVGAGGIGGGGAGSVTNVAVSGTANTGGGGGGTHTGTVGNGGSGVVIVRYKFQ